MSMVRFHQDIAVIEKRFKGKWSTGMLAEYCWSLKRDKPEQEHKRRRVELRSVFAHNVIFLLSFCVAPF